MLSTILILAGFGIVALVVELVVPGGILGVAGMLCLIAAAIMSFVEYGFVVGFLVSMAIGLLAFSVVWLWMRYFHRLPGTRELILQNQHSQGDAQPDTASLVGEVGEALTEISPSGRAICGTTRYDVIAESTALP